MTPDTVLKIAAFTRTTTDADGGNTTEETAEVSLCGGREAPTAKHLQQIVVR